MNGVFTADGMFVISQWVLAVGTIALLDIDDERDRLYLAVVTVPMTIYVLASIAAYFVITGSSRTGSSRPKITIVVLRPSHAMITLLGLSILVTVAYFQAVGYNVFLLGIQGLFTDTTHDYAALRIASYSGAGYFFPGYVNQFKNIILPSMVVLVVVYLFHNKVRLRRTLSAALICVALIGLLGTGQRGAFILFALTLVTFLYHMNRPRFLRRVLITAVSVAPLLVFVTVMLGRSASKLAIESDDLGRVNVLGSELLRRFFHDNQWSGQMAFWYTYKLPQQNGSEWLQSLAGVLPGVGDSGPNLSQQVFKMLYGTTRGTAPPSIWGSVYYNWGWAGLMIVPVGLAVSYQVITRRALSRNTINTLELIGMSGCFVVLGYWVAGGPERILNAGGVTFAILWWIGRRSNRGINERAQDPNNTQREQIRT